MTAFETNASYGGGAISLWTHPQRFFPSIDLLNPPHLLLHSNPVNPSAIPVKHTGVNADLNLIRIERREDDEVEVAIARTANKVLYGDNVGLPHRRRLVVDSGLTRSEK
jgi:hypothetical protein